MFTRRTFGFPVLPHGVFTPFDAYGHMTLESKYLASIPVECVIAIELASSSARQGAWYGSRTSGCELRRCGRGCRGPHEITVSGLMGSRAGL
jgi:hypothetical protein